MVKACFTSHLVRNYQIPIAKNDPEVRKMAIFQQAKTLRFTLSIPGVNVVLRLSRDQRTGYNHKNGHPSVK